MEPKKMNPVLELVQLFTRVKLRRDGHDPSLALEVDERLCTLAANLADVTPPKEGPGFLMAFFAWLQTPEGKAFLAMIFKLLLASAAG